MSALEIIFWIIAFGIVYTYLGYGLVLYLMVRIKRLFIKRVIPELSDDELPEITLLVAAYNEYDYVDEKMQNTLAMNYPAQKLHLMWVTDGSDDGTPELIRERYPQVEVLHQPERRGKIAAMNRAVKFVKTPIIVFSDANTVIGTDSLRRIAALFSKPDVGCVSGEKRILNEEKAAASSAGEGIYWKYESTLKRWDAELYSAVGAAGELFAVRTELFNEVEPDTLLDDFIISLRIAMKGYRIEYDPDAYAAEWASASIAEELKRKIRIAAGGIQSVVRLYPLLNIFKYGILSFQYISHRVLRWAVTPFLLPLALIINILLAPDSILYSIMLILQGLFYLGGFVGQQLEHRKLKVKIFFIPYYFLFMNYAVFLGFFRYLRNQQSVNWERARRMEQKKH
ncbi:MAG: glycosyltransferase family 2 protein [Paludibacter sp.]|jgi:cellulose synthase/poly-beta-1,6-N-acetylglucosamine synthase-like glycosyltransferase|nr:glycosyltransferase family 2 protein [Paludibacter sp.]